jgi:signal peptidase I
MPDPAPARHQDRDSTAVGMLQSLIVAFVLAMTFRGFVVEGFVIPTGSMAPTLLGEHLRLHSDETGWDFAVGVDPRLRRIRLDQIVDPMLGPEYPLPGVSRAEARPRMGDRILVLKDLYHFFDPQRFDVMVFKNPTDPNGPAGNYIKRLIGLPNESIWLVDGDVFAGSAEHPDDFDAYEIQRKPEYIQRAVWQPVYDSDYPPVHPERLDVYYRGAPWVGENWQTEDRRSYRCDLSEPTLLRWEEQVRPIDDWTPYNMLTPAAGRRRYPVNDIRVAAAVVPDQDGLGMTFRLKVRSYEYEYTIGRDTASVRMRPLADDRQPPDAGWEGPEAVAAAPLPAGEPTDVEFWHVDQTMAIYLDGRRIAYYEYDWRPVERLRNATGSDGDVRQLAAYNHFRHADVSWEFRGSPVTLYRVRLDRDLYYRPERLTEHAQRNPTSEGFEDIVEAGNYAYGTHPDNLAILGPDHFFMLGDNSAASSDSRLWGNPHPLTAVQIEPAPFVVHRRLLLGKAWGVYFPAPLPLGEGGRSIIPDFGRLRFIR